MNQLNQIIIEGNVVRSAQVREFSTGRKLCTIPIAVNRTYKSKDGTFEKETSYFDIEAWGENFCNLLETKAVKGRALRIVGRLKQNRWKTEDGKNESRVSIVADHVEFRPLKKDADEKPDADCEASSDEETASSEMENLEEAANALRDEVSDSEAVF